MTDNVLPFLPTALEREVESHLQDAGVHDIGSYGWLNENDEDPEMIGHAMWQIDQPWIDHNAVIGDTPAQRRPPEVEKLGLTLGEDFCGLIQASRLSLGLALVWARQAKMNVLAESTYFWLHHTDAFIKLAIASDRLRDLLVVACTGEAPEVYKKRARKNRLFVTPFADAETLLSVRGLSDPRLLAPLTDLASHAEALFVKIDRRNSIVHKIATRMARYTQNAVASLQAKFDEQKAAGFVPRTTGSMDWLPSAQARMEELESEIDEAVNELKDWYALLIRSSNNVFQVEYWSRTLAPPPKDAS